jgi:hypothetical protein
VRILVMEQQEALAGEEKILHPLQDRPTEVVHLHRLLHHRHHPDDHVVHLAQMAQTHPVPVRLPKGVIPQTRNERSVDYDEN